jgi:hypothetical protein
VLNSKVLPTMRWAKYCVDLQEYNSKVVLSTACRAVGKVLFIGTGTNLFGIFKGTDRRVVGEVQYLTGMKGTNTKPFRVLPAIRWAK